MEEMLASGDVVNLLTLVGLDSLLEELLEVVPKQCESFSSPEMLLVGLSSLFMPSISVQRLSPDYISIAQATLPIFAT